MTGSKAPLNLRTLWRYMNVYYYYYYYYYFVNGKLSCQRGLGALKYDHTVVFTGDTERALNDYFESMCTEDNGVVPVMDRIVPDNSTLETIALPLIACITPSKS
jgi:hypothetical protein